MLSSSNLHIFLLSDYFIRCLSQQKSFQQKVTYTVKHPALYTAQFYISFTIFFQTCLLESRKAGSHINVLCTVYCIQEWLYIEIKPNEFTTTCMERIVASSNKCQCLYLLSEPIQLLECDTFICHLPHVSVVFCHILQILEQHTWKTIPRWWLPLHS